MSEYREKASRSFKTFDWRQLPPGVYENKNGAAVRVDNDTDAASDKVSSALRRFAEMLET